MTFSAHWQVAPIGLAQEVAADCGRWTRVGNRDRKQNQISTQNPDHFSVQNNTMNPNSAKIRLE
jgi:hypothetical protein